MKNLTFYYTIVNVKKEYGGIENESNIIARYKRGWKKR